MRRGAIARVLIPPASLGIAVWVGWSLGYQSLAAYIVFGILCALVSATARRIVRSAFPPATSPVDNVDNVGNVSTVDSVNSGDNDEILRIGVVSFALIVLAGFVLGSAGFISVGAYLAFFAVALVCSLKFRVPRSGFRARRTRTMHPEPGTRNLEAVIAGILVAAVAFILAVGIIQSPLTLYDSLSYHLLFPARWLQDHRLSIVPTPFSDPAQAYQPSNGELFFLWLMLPFHGDLLARIGQVPFLLLGGAALFVLARRLGATRAHAIYAPLFFFLARPVVEQAVGADVDLISAAVFAASIYFGLIAVDTDRARDWALWGVSLGLFFGTKYLALVYTPVFLLFPVVRGVRLKSAWAIPGIALWGFPWYLRNWVIAGSPIYPASLGVGALTIARGAFSRAAMSGTVFHATGLHLWSVVAAHAFGAPLALFWLPCALAAAAAILARHRWWPAGFIVFLVVLMAPLEWLGLPSNIDSRFLLPAVTTAIVLFALPFGTSARWKVWNAAVHVIYFAGAVWLLTGANTEIHTTTPWYMGGWLSLNGIVNSRHFVWFAVFTVLGAWTWRAAPAWRLRAGGALAIVAASVLVMGVDVRCAPERCEPLQVTSIFVQPSFLEAWDWVAHNTRSASFANTGNNVAYPLFGDQLTNRVSYVNIDRHADWRLHDYARARMKSGASPLTTPLAIASGELVAAPGGDASRPRFERVVGYRDGWMSNLKALGIDHLFVSTLSAYEVDYVWHNDGGFPIEDDWARADPSAFTIVFENSHVRIYAVSQAALAALATLTTSIPGPAAPTN